MSSQIVLILGAGANIGKSLVQKFSSKGFKVAIASRTLNAEVSKLADTIVKADFSNPSSIKSIFEKVKSEIGTPNVVIYNAAAVTFAPKNQLAGDLATFEKNLAINTTSAFAAAQEAVAGFDTLSASTLKSFIYTGNGLNVVTPMPALLDLGVGKAATAHLIHAASLSYKDAGYRFYYTDERKPNGDVVGNAISGEAAGEFYYELSQKAEQGPWDATFVAGKGYVDFQSKL